MLPTPATAAPRSVFATIPAPHVWPMQQWWETAGAAYMMRQHFASSLYDRLSTRPFLTPMEKVQQREINTQPKDAGLAWGGWWW